MKRRFISILSAILCCLSLTACSVTETEEYKQLQAAYDTLQANYTELEGNYNDLEVSNNATKASEDFLSGELANLKEDYKELENKYASLESKYATLEFAGSVVTLGKSTAVDDGLCYSGVATAVYLDAGDYTLKCLRNSNSVAQVSISLEYTISDLTLVKASPVTVCKESITEGSSTAFNVQIPGYYYVTLTDTTLIANDESDITISITEQYS